MPRQIQARSYHNLRTPYPDNYLHYYAMNALSTSLGFKSIRDFEQIVNTPADPAAMMYSNIMNGRQSLATNFARPQAFSPEQMLALGGASGRVAARKVLNEARQKELEALLENTWFDEGGSNSTEFTMGDIQYGLSEKGMNLGNSAPSGDVMAALRSFGNDSLKDLSTVEDFYQKAKEVLQKILDAGHIQQLADAYAQEILNRVITTGNTTMSTKTAQALVNKILSENQGQFFNILDASSPALNTDDLLSQMALLVAALPAANFSAGQSVTIGTHHTTIEAALRAKLDSWMGTLSQISYNKASAIALGSLVAKNNDQLSNLKVGFVGGDNKVVYKEDPQIKADAAEAKSIADGAKQSIKTDTLSIETTNGGVTTRVYLYAPGTAAGAVVGGKTKRIDITLTEGASFLDILTHDVGTDQPNFIHDLIQILTYRDVTPKASTGFFPANIEKGYEARAEKTWEEIKNMLPYLFLVNRLTGLFADAPQRFDTAFFAFGNQILPANIVMFHIFDTIGKGVNNSRAYAKIQGNVNRSAFVRINKYRRRIVSNEQGRRTWVPNRELALERSAETYAKSLDILRNAKITIKLHLAQLAALSMSSISF